MRIGVNVTSPTNFPIAMALVRAGHAQYVELLVDNFLHVAPAVLARDLAGVPVSFHVMNSRFFERDAVGLDELAGRLRALARILRPLYLSDHLARFTHEGRRLPMLLELDAERDYAAARERVAAWQERLGERLHIENFPSVLGDGNAQAEFYGRLVAETGCGVLFDFCNAVVAELNTGYAATTWLPVVRAMPHFHVAGFRRTEGDPALVIDSHDGPIAPETLTFMQAFERERGGLAGLTLVVERDANIELAPWAADIQAARRVQAGVHV